MENQELEEKKAAEQLTKDEEYIWLRALERFRAYKETADTLDIVGESKEVIFDGVKERFQEEKEKREKDIATLRDNLQNTFDFLKQLCRRTGNGYLFDRTEYQSIQLKNLSVNMDVTAIISTIRNCYSMKNMQKF